MEGSLVLTGVGISLEVLYLMRVHCVLVLSIWERIVYCIVYVEVVLFFVK